MTNILISGPAGGGKSQEARRLLAAASVPTVMIEFQQIYAGLLGIERLPNGRYPPRRPQDAYALPMAEYLRQAAITGAIAQELGVLLSNSDGNQQRRQFLLGRLGRGSRERLIDPGIEIVTQRLSVDGLLDPDCQDAINRWYGRLNR